MGNFLNGSFLTSFPVPCSASGDLIESFAEQLFCLAQSTWDASLRETVRSVTLGASAWWGKASHTEKRSDKADRYQEQQGDRRSQKFTIL